MKKVEAINAECQQGMVDTELAFISAGRQAAATSRSNQTSAIGTLGITNATPVTSGFFTGSQYNAPEPRAAAQG